MKVRQSSRYIVFALALVAVGCAQSSTSGPSSSVRVAEAGWSFGFCMGPCRGQLALAGAQLTYEVSSRTGDQVFASNRGQLTSQGATRLEYLASGLPEELQETYGCPDCADGGASFLAFVRERESLRTEYEYGNPPAALSAIDGFLKEVMDALGECRATADVTPEGSCTPLPD
ncbi:MAG: hypothetical protein ACRD1X_04495 [Vicinamibacteria bacterium]